MEFMHIDIANLAVSAANMRAKGMADIANILPTIRKRGILVPLIVRPNGVEGHYEIVAGKRRYQAARTIAEEQGGIEPLPCAVLAAGDDAAALEASLIENWARLAPSEVANWTSFAKLVKEGRTVEDIALTFGLTILQVKRTLALGNLHPRIRRLYDADKIDAVTVRHLTLATPKQQKEWLALLDCPEKHAPTGSSLKAFLFGGASIPTSAALFDLADYEGEIVTDLFGEDGYFADAESFWTVQVAAIEARRTVYLESGWADVVVMEVGDYFQSWEHRRTTKAKGGKVFVAITRRGEVSFHEGHLSLKEVRKQERANAPKPIRGEVTAAMNNYLDLHRHAAVRASLATRGDIGLRLMVAHVIHGSPLWTIRCDPQRAASDAIAESIETSEAETVFDRQRRTVLAMLGFDPDTPTVVGGDDGEHGIAGLFVKLLALSDSDILSIVAIVMSETLAVGAAEIEAVGSVLNTSLCCAWSADDAFLDLIRDKPVLTAMVAELAGENAAKANEGATAKVLRDIVRDCVIGCNGREKHEGWLPKWLNFPASAYTERGGVGCVDAASRAATLFAPVECEEQEQRKAA